MSRCLQESLVPIQERDGNFTGFASLYERDTSDLERRYEHGRHDERRLLEPPATASISVAYLDLHKCRGSQRECPSKPERLVKVALATFIAGFDRSKAMKHVSTANTTKRISCRKQNLDLCAVGDTPTETADEACNVIKQAFAQFDQSCYSPCFV